MPGRTIPRRVLPILPDRSQPLRATRGPAPPAVPRLVSLRLGIRSLALTCLPHHAMPHLETPCLTPPNAASPARPRPALPLVPFRDSPRLPCLLLPADGTPRTTYSVRACPSWAFHALPEHTTQRRASPEQSMPALPIRTLPGLAVLVLACHNVRHPCPAFSGVELPGLSCPALPDPADPGPGLSSNSKRSLPRQILSGPVKHSRERRCLPSPAVPVATSQRVA